MRTRWITRRRRLVAAKVSAPLATPWRVGQARSPTHCRRSSCRRVGRFLGEPTLTQAPKPALIQRAMPIKPRVTSAVQAVTSAAVRSARVAARKSVQVWECLVSANCCALPAQLSGPAYVFKRSSNRPPPGSRGFAFMAVWHGLNSLSKFTCHSAFRSESTCKYTPIAHGRDSTAPSKLPTRTHPLSHEPPRTSVRPLSELGTARISLTKASTSRPKRSWLTSSAFDQHRDRGDTALERRGDLITNKVTLDAASPLQ